MAIDNDHDREKRIADEVRRTLESFDGQSPMEASPHFTAHVVQKISLARTREDSLLARLFPTWRLRAAALAALLLANLATAFFALQTSSSAYSRDQYLESMVQRYQVDFPAPLASGDNQ
jgi:hypothetical protein